MIYRKGCKMAQTKAHKEATARWDQKAYFKTLVRFKADRESEIRKYAGESLNGFIVSAVEEKIERMKKNDLR